MSDILGGRATAVMLLSYAMRVGVLRLQQSDFMDLWAGFAGVLHSGHAVPAVCVCCGAFLPCRRSAPCYFSLGLP